MAVVPLTIAQIKECINKLAKNAKEKIPTFPKETWNVEHHYVSELLEKDGEQYIIALKFNPALMNEKMKKELKKAKGCAHGADGGLCAPFSGGNAGCRGSRRGSDCGQWPGYAFPGAAGIAGG